ncbi:DeoR family transcriptional regulator [Quadrisphaera oryzae]|uniref:DeoR family transcriptional regulator n=1 Tax=Quadrisphaera TaxID=317661 RepID=UPI0016444F1D|nr:DeoR family transcriptional regulator [Quadrisphaera sp. RL12-1S]MBC3761136.1 DeoR family transcriptional regulator [Quadrisphaera sp. RL12-1S]
MCDVSGERWDEITRWVDAEGRVGLAELASRFEVSEMTIRRDLDALTAAGRLRRVRGGAISLTTAPPSAPRPTPAPQQAPTRPAPPAPSGPPASVDQGRGAPSSAAPVVHTGVEAGVEAEPDPVASPGFDPSRAPSSLGSVIASWAGAFPSGFPTPQAAPARETPAPATAPAPHAPAEAETPPGWDVPLPPARPASPPASPPAHPDRPRDHHLEDQPVTRPAPPAETEDPWARAARAALGELAPGAAVLLTGGTGALALAHHVARLAARSPTAPLTVAVTALAPATVLSGAPGVRLVVLGGEAEHAGTDLVGPSALAALEDLHLDVAVLTPTGLDARGAWAPTSAAAALVAAAVARAERTVAVVAPGVLGRPGLVRAAPLGALQEVVAVPAPGEDTAALTARLEAVRSGAPSAPRVTAA